MNGCNRNYARNAGSPLAVVEAQFARIGDEPVPLSSKAARALPESPVTWGRLRELLADTSVPFEVMDVDVVWVWLIERARREGPAVMACAGVALPMIAATAARLARRVGGDRADAEAALLSAFVDAVARLNLAQAHPWCALRWATYKGGRAWEKQEATSPAPIPPADLGERPAAGPGHPELLLAQAVGEGVLDQATAEVIAETRLAGRTLVAVAAERGESYKALHKRRTSAERRLQHWLHARLADTDPDRTSVVESAALDEIARTRAGDRPGVPPVLRVVANSEGVRTGTRCAGKSGVSAQPTHPEVDRCA